MTHARFYIPQLDGLRFIAFLIVFVGHATNSVAYRAAGALPWYSGERWGHSALLAGGFGVDLFFVLSSYLITTLLVREADARGYIDVPAFWLRRVLRIWPLYFGFVLTYALLGGLTWRMLGAFSVFAGNWAMASWGDTTGLAGPLWSVSVEEQFYLAWPLVLAVLPRRLLRVVCYGLIVAAVTARYLLFASGVGITPVWLNTFSHLDAIGIGALIALVPRAELAPAARGALGAGSALALVVCAGVIWYELLGIVPAGAIYVRAGYEAPASLAFLGAALACGGLLVAVLAGSAWLSRPALVYLGRISYGLYVFHMAAIGLVGGGWWPWRLLVGFALTMTVAAVSYRYFEGPFLRLKQRFTHVASSPSERRPTRHDAFGSASSLHAP